MRKKFDSNWLIFQKRSEVIPGGQQEKNPVKILSYSNLQILYLSYMSKIRMPYVNKSISGGNACLSLFFIGGTLPDPI